MKSNNLLSRLTDLEGQLNHFSFEELTSEEASQLKKSFMTFKYRLEEKVLGPKSKVAPSIVANKDFDLVIGHNELDNTNKNTLNRTDGKLLANLGDEIRTPITDIIESVDLLKEGNLTAQQTSQLNSISNSSNCLLEIINEILEYTKLTSGKEKFESIDFNFYSMIRDTQYLCNTLIINKDVTLKVDMDTDIPEILLGDPSKLSHILLSLLGNSIKNIDKGNILLKIKLRKEQRNYYFLDFEIMDSPTGTSESKSVPNKDLTEGMETTTNSSGIGFAMVKGILEVLNGEIATIGTLEDGCAFKFTIPYKKGKKTKTLDNPFDSESKGITHKIKENLPQPSIKKETWAVSLTDILEECMGEVDLLEELIGLFKKNMLDFIGRANIYIPEGNFNRLGFAAHKVKTGLSMMKAERLYSLVDEIIVCCKGHKNLQEIGRLYDQLLLAYPMVEKAIDKELILLKNKKK